MITLTDTAAVKVKELLEAEGATDLALRVAVRSAVLATDVFSDSSFARSSAAPSITRLPVCAYLSATLAHQDQLAAPLLHVDNGFDVVDNGRRIASIDHPVLCF